MLIRSPVLAAAAHLAHGFVAGTRGSGPVRLTGGVPAAPPDWRALAVELGAPGLPVARAHQVHGAGVLEVEQGGAAGEGDALVARRPGLLVTVRTADCVPILAWSERGVAAIHAGWRGLVAGVVPAAVECLGGRVTAAVGPCIGVDHYEVGDEVVAALVSAGLPELVARPGPRGRAHADLRAAAVWQLEQADAVVDDLACCTWAHAGLPSHRRDGVRSGRLVAGVAVLA